jgi:PBP1b-binding outer membrane lipoprotein LpoB
MIKIIFSLFLSTLLLSGCTSSPKKGGAMQIAPSLHTMSKGDFLNSSKPIELPQNYSTKNYKRLVVSAYFFPQKGKGDSNLPIGNLSTRLETQLSKLKRFTIVSRHLGQKGIMAEKSFQDMGTTNRKGKLRMGKQLNADYSLSGSITATKEEYDRVDHNEALFIVRIDYQLVDNETGEIIEADTAEGRDKRKLIRLPSGKFIGGFNPSDSKQLKDAIDNAGLNALKVVGNKIGNKLPVGGRISGFKGQRFAMESGHEDGFMGDQIVILYGSDMGIDMPFAVGEVHPGKYKTSGKIIRWSNDPDVQDIISGIKSDKFYFNKNELYAVSNGMPLPPAWDKNYRD